MTMAAYGSYGSNMGKFKNKQFPFNKNQLRIAIVSWLSRFWLEMWGAKGSQYVQSPRLKSNDA